MQLGDQPPHHISVPSDHLRFMPISILPSGMRSMRGVARGGLAT
jgi:hypothetical protein